MSSDILENWIMIHKDNSLTLPSQAYDVTKELYLCVTIDGEIAVCKYMGYDTTKNCGMGRWQLAHGNHEYIPVVAYQDIAFPASKLIHRSDKCHDTDGTFCHYYKEPAYRPRWS